MTQISYESQTTSKFRALLSELSPEIRAEARKAYKLFRDNPRHPGLKFKKLVDNIWSARVSQEYRVLGVVTGDDVVWFWIGAYGEYDRIVDQLRRR